MLYVKMSNFKKKEGWVPPRYFWDMREKHMSNHAPRNSIKTDCEKKTCIAII